MKQVPFCLILFWASTAAAEEGAYKFLTPSEPLAVKPWHKTFIFEGAKTSEGKPNAGAKQIGDLSKVSQKKGNQDVTATIPPGGMMLFSMEFN